MNEQNWKSTQYESWDEAFKGLVPAIRQQSVRVADYTQVLFDQACASSFGTNSAESAERMQGQNSDLAYKCGLYHQLGKCLLAPELQLWHMDFSDEWKANYRTYPAKGRLLVANLQEKTQKSRYKKSSDDAERPTTSIPWLMVRESCEQHMERFDGSGYPSGLVGDEISPIAQIVGLAKELDRLVSETKSENPFDEAFVTLLNKGGKEFSEELIQVLKAARGKCRGIYKKYIQYTKTIPKTIPLVDKRSERPMGIKYSVVEGFALPLFEAVPWFKGVLNDSNKMESLEKLEPMLLRTKILREVMFYLLYEVTDTILRIKNSKLQIEGILVPMPDGFFKGEGLLETMEQLFLDQPIDSSKLWLSVPVETVVLASAQEKELLTTCVEDGIQLVLDGYRPDTMGLDLIQDIGFSKVRISSDIGDVLVSEATATLTSLGIQLVGRGDYDLVIEEEKLIKDLLSAEQ